MGILDKKHYYLYNVLSKIDEENPVDLSTLDKRVEFQKKVYLLKSVGLPLNYKFGSYIKGPYSSGLAEIGFDIYESPEEAIPDKEHITTIDEDNLEKINRIKNLVINLPKEKTHAYWLELIASLHFLKVNAYPPVSNWDSAKNRLQMWKPNKFSKNHMNKAIDLIKKHDLVS
jgi:uncharacterized protein YwgA